MNNVCLDWLCLGGTEPREPRMNKSLVVRPKDVCLELGGISLRSYYRLVKSGHLTPIRITQRCSGIRREELNAYIANAPKVGAE